MQRVIDERITLDLRDKIPYGTAAVKKLLPFVFPNAAIYYDKRSPGNWDSISTDFNRQAVVLMGKEFYPDEVQMSRLLRFVRQGNYVFIIAKSFSTYAKKVFNFSISMDIQDYFLSSLRDSLAVKLNDTSFRGNNVFVYPGKKYEGYFNFLDSTHVIVLGRNAEGFPDFIQYETGNGKIFIHSAPLAFSNYFILHKNNIKYFEKTMSVIPKNTNKVLWNEYYLERGNNSIKDPSWLKVLFQYPSFKWGMLTAMFLLILFGLTNMRRRQRMIIPHQKPINDSLDFVKTLGRLYYERHDHRNLATKMSVYFLDHVRGTYKIATHNLDQQFIELLGYKTGYPLPELTRLVSSVKEIPAKPVVSEKELAEFYNQLELFYQKT